MNEIQQVHNLITSGVTAYFKNQHTHLTHQLALLRTLSPRNILKRGFAIVRKNDKTMINAGSIRAGEQISIILGSEELVSTVNYKNDYNGNDFDI